MRNNFLEFFKLQSQYQITICSLTHHLYGEKLSRQKGHRPTQTTLSEPTFSTFRYKTWRTVYMRKKKLARLERRPAQLGHPFVMVDSPTQPGQILPTFSPSQVNSVEVRRSENAQVLFQTIRSLAEHAQSLLTRERGQLYSHIDAR